LAGDAYYIRTKEKITRIAADQRWRPMRATAQSIWRLRPFVSGFLRKGDVHVYGIASPFEPIILTHVRPSTDFLGSFSCAKKTIAQR
jgi:hypothetical protein